VAAREERKKGVSEAQGAKDRNLTSQGHQVLRGVLVHPDAATDDSVTVSCRNHTCQKSTCDEDKEREKGGCGVGM
jgi:hypothetical protein